MVRALQSVTTFCVFACLGVAQVSEHDLKRSYPSEADGAFLIQPGVKLKGVFDEQGRACSLTLHGEISEDQALRLFDVLVPAKSRGVKKQDMIECVGACQRDIVYENVTFATGAVGHQRSEPAAIIKFSRADCKTALEEADKIVLDIKR
jgi:hypothetical protein